MIRVHISPAEMNMALAGGLLSCRITGNRIITPDNLRLLARLAPALLHSSNTCRAHPAMRIGYVKVCCYRKISSRILFNAEDIISVQNPISDGSSNIAYPCVIFGLG